MKIGDSNANAPGGDDLFERMERAHRQEAAEGVDGPNAAACADSAQTAQDATRPGELQAGDVQEPDALHSRLLDAADRALDGGFGSAEQLRQEVVEVIVEQRYAEQLPDDQADLIKQTLCATLTDDPGFRKEVDNMLVLAAGELGRADK